MDRLSEIRARCEAATPGPWEVKVKGNTVESHQVMSPGNGSICSAISPKTKNAQFIAHAREDIPYLLSLLEETWEWDMYQCAKRETERLRGILAEQNARLNQYEAENRWIPVGERLPENGVNVLCKWGHDKAWHKGIVIGYQYSGVWYFPEISMSYWTDITHWRPLPEPPEEARHV